MLRSWIAKEIRGIRITKQAQNFQSRSLNLTNSRFKELEKNVGEGLNEKTTLKGYTYEKFHIDERFKNLQEYEKRKLDELKQNVSLKYHELEEYEKRKLEELKLHLSTKYHEVEEFEKRKYEEFKANVATKYHQIEHRVEDSFDENREKMRHRKDELRQKTREKKELVILKTWVKKEQLKEKTKIKSDQIKDKTSEKVENAKARGKEIRAKTRERAKRENWYTVPNAISASRVVMAPVIGLCIVNGHVHAALSLNCISAVSDFLDGKIARVWPSQQSALGTALDPLADKVTMLAVYSALYISDGIPNWLFFTIIGRDVALVIGTAIGRYQTLPTPKNLKRYMDFGLVTVKIKPTWISKTNTVLQFILPMWILALKSGYLEAYEFATLPFCALTFTTTTISTFEYLYFKKDLITGAPTVEKIKL